ncbi:MULTISPECIES: RCC1 domain-containing protein [Deinococcus]|uniref:RCC1 domain-containing protein n=1 Tax=Deinococcus rufus TaxID=2136097 RepID=A0ABV7Z1P4_9DEIO|nr:hypothetical protein [Deinococcus sp. AB2017081]WQE95201.1 hypothetical protein U2P90_17740 [Deinococcus sp. AB2017081]
MTYTLTSVVKQFDPGTRALRNYVNFPTRGGRSLPAYYDVTATDSTGTAVTTPLVMCGDTAAVAITDIRTTAHPRRFRVEVQELGDHLLTVQAGSTCTPSGTALVAQPVRGTALAPQGFTLSAGGLHSLALMTDDAVKAWGDNSFGQLGDGTNSNVDRTFAPIKGLSGVVAVSAGEDHSLALRSDGTVLAWGSNSRGQLSDASTYQYQRATPVAVGGLSGVISVTAGYWASLAIVSDGTVRAWGWNQNGQLGDGTTTDHLTPVAVKGLDNVVALATGEVHTLALRSDGTVRAWGFNGAAQLGDGTTTARTTPVAVDDLTDVVELAAGHGHSLALKADGTVEAWGNNIFGQLGEPPSAIVRATPAPVSGLSGIVHVSTGASSSLALTSDGTVLAWPSDAGTPASTGGAPPHVPAVVGGLKTVIAVDAGSGHHLALQSDGTVQAWGGGGAGQLGYDVAGNRSTPAPVTSLGSVKLPTP